MLSIARASRYRICIHAFTMRIVRFSADCEMLYYTNEIAGGRQHTMKPLKNICIDHASTTTQDTHEQECAGSMAFIFFCIHFYYTIYFESIFHSVCRTRAR